MLRLTVVLFVFTLISLQAPPECNASRLGLGRIAKRNNNTNNNNNNNNNNTNNNNNNSWNNTTPIQNEVSYVFFIYAGSSGSTMFLYKINLHRDRNVVTVSGLTFLKNNLGEIKPALSKLRNEKFEISSYLEKFINEAKKIVPVNSWESTPILFIATKGIDMAIMERVQDVLKDKYVSPFLYKDDNILVISNKDEAFFGWIYKALQVPVVVLVKSFI